MVVGKKTTIWPGTLKMLPSTALKDWPVVLLEPGEDASAPLQDRLRQHPGSIRGAHKVTPEEVTVLIHQCPVDLCASVLP